MFLMQISKIKRKIYLLKEQNTNNFNVAGKYEQNSSMNMKLVMIKKKRTMHKF